MVCDAPSFQRLGSRHANLSALVVIALDLLTMLPSAGGVVAGGWQWVGVAGLLGAGVILFQQTL